MHKNYIFINIDIILNIIIIYLFLKIKEFSNLYFENTVYLLFQAF